MDWRGWSRSIVWRKRAEACGSVPWWCESWAAGQPSWVALGVMVVWQPPAQDVAEWVVHIGRRPDDDDPYNVMWRVPSMDHMGYGLEMCPTAQSHVSHTPPVDVYNSIYVTTKPEKSGVPPVPVLSLPPEPDR